MISSPITRPITSRIASAIAGARTGGGISYDYYVDSVVGSDANDGTKSSAAFATIAAAVSAGGASTDGLKIGLARGSHWRESLVLTGDNVLVGAYGSGKMPILDAGDVASTWSKTGGQTNVYEISWTPEDTPASGKSNITVLEHDGTDITKLKRVYTLGDCDSTAGTWYASYSTNIVGSPQTVYIHTTDSSDPDSNGLVYTIPSRHYGVKLDGSGTLRGIRARQNLHNDGSIVVWGNALVSECMAEFGHIHNMLVSSGVVEDCIFWEMCEVITTAGNHTMFVAYSASGIGKSITIKGCVFANSIYPDYVNNSSYSHTDSNSTPYDSITMEDNSYFNVYSCVGMGNNPLSYIDRRTSAENIDMVLKSSSANCEVYDTYVRGVMDNGSRMFQLQAVFDGIRSYTPIAFSGGAFGLAFKEGSEVKNSVLVASRSSPFSTCIYDTSDTANITFNSNIMVSWNNAVSASNAAAVYSGDNNVFYDVNQWAWHGSNITSLASWQSTSGEDANSVTTNPDLVDPANGDFTPQASGLPTVGLLRPNITYTSVPTKAEIEAM